MQSRCRRPRGAPLSFPHRPLKAGGKTIESWSQGHACRPALWLRMAKAGKGHRDGKVSWELGNGDSAMLARYRAAADPTATARFPADRDRFHLLDCAAAICVEEAVSGARWAPPVEATATQPAPAGSAAATSARRPRFETGLVASVRGGSGSLNRDSEVARGLRSEPGLQEAVPAPSRSPGWTSSPLAPGRWNPLRCAPCVAGSAAEPGLPETFPSRLGAAGRCSGGPEAASAYFVARLGWSRRTVTRWPRSEVARRARIASSAM